MTNTNTAALDAIPLTLPTKTPKTGKHARPLTLGKLPGMGAWY